MGEVFWKFIIIRFYCYFLVYLIHNPILISVISSTNRVSFPLFSSFRLCVMII